MKRHRLKGGIRKKPSLQNIYVFGSKVYAHIPKELRRKLDEKTKEFVFIRYIKNAKGYCLLDTSIEKITLSRDVIFLDENSKSNEIIVQEEKID